MGKKSAYEESVDLVNEINAEAAAKEAAAAAAKE
jgi:hypothetical protein